MNGIGEQMTGPVSIILVAYHGDRWIRRCLESLCGACAGECEVILVDNGGNSALEVYVDRPNVRIIRTPRTLGFAEANNYALVHGGVDGKVVCFLNQDTLSGPGWLDACVDLMNRRADIGAVMPLITNYDGTDWDEAFRTCAKAAPNLAARLAAGPQADLSDLPEFVAVPEITAAAMVVRTEALLKAGPFDPIYGSYYEDYDLCRRIAAAGYQVGICRRGRVGHYGGSVTSSPAAYRRRARQIYRNRIIYAARWRWQNRLVGMFRQICFRFARDLARSALGRSNTPLRALLLAHWDVAGLAMRLVSGRRDQRRWQADLAALGWPNAVSGGSAGAGRFVPSEA